LAALRAERVIDVPRQDRAEIFESITRLGLSNDLLSGFDRVKA
jgi:hypothetical protein